MKNFLLKLILFFAIYLSIVGVCRLILPSQVGNEFLLKKLEDYQTKSSNVNTVFFGNSYINRHINPLIFDSLTTIPTVSYNLATDATPFMERSFIMETFLKKHRPDRVIMLVCPSADIREENLNHLRTIYYHDLKRTNYGLSYRHDKPKQKFYHLISFVRNQLQLFSLKDLFTLQLTGESLPEVVQHQRGFFGYDQETGMVHNPGLVKNKIAFEKRLNQLKTKGPVEHFDLKEADHVMYQECLRLKQVAAGLDVELYFLFLPGSPRYAQFDLDNTIYMGDTRDLAELYDFSNWYNKGHLNTKGAELFSIKAAEAFNRTIAL